MEYKNTYNKCYAIVDIMKSVKCYKFDKTSAHNSKYMCMFIKLLIIMPSISILLCLLN